MVKLWRGLRPDAIAVLRDENARKALGRYFDVMDDLKPAKYLISKKIAANRCDNLWDAHARALETYNRIEPRIKSLADLDSMETPDFSLLDLKVEIAKHILSHCEFCERRCKVDRTKELGDCNAGIEPQISSYFSHFGEEPELVPSFTIFFMGCNLHCQYCQNWSISQWYEASKRTSVVDLAHVIERARRQGNRNVNFVGGDPTPWTHVVLETMNNCDVNIPVVWNSNAIYSREVAELLKGFVDVYLLDFRYGPGDCSELSRFKGYWGFAKRNHQIAYDDAELIVRQLVLPNHVECCTKLILSWLASLSKGVRVNLMFQYRPEYNAFEHEEINRTLTFGERKRALEIARDTGLRDYIT